jgi:hypothetical protein
VKNFIDKLKDGELKDKYFVVPLAARELSCTTVDTTTHKYYTHQNTSIQKIPVSANAEQVCRIPFHHHCSHGFKKLYQVTKRRDPKTSLFLFTIRNQNIQNVWGSKQPCTHF